MQGADVKGPMTLEQLDMLADALIAGERSVAAQRRSTRLLLRSTNVGEVTPLVEADRARLLACEVPAFDGDQAGILGQQLSWVGCMPYPWDPTRSPD